MTALILQVTPFIEIVVTKLRAMYTQLRHALDAFTETKMRNAVPEWQLRNAQREIKHYRRLMRADRKLPVTTARPRH